MMRSLYAGVSGLQNHQVRTDVIGNNISNINTNAFKKARVNFHDMISQTIQGSSRPSDNLGGTNAKQVGLGMSLASIDTMMYQGSLQTTGKQTDLAIQGEGFFIQRKGSEIFYTRAGNYSIDRNKNLVNPANGFRLQGWNAIMDAEGNFNLDNSGSYEDIIVPVGDKFQARATDEVVLKSNLNSEVEPVQNADSPSDKEKISGAVHRTSIDVYDVQGKLHKLSVTFVKKSVNQWQAKVEVSDSIENSVLFDVGVQGNVDQNTDKKDTIVINFDDQGAINSVSESGDNNPDSISQGDLMATVVFRVDNGTVQPGIGGAKVGREQRVNLKLGTERMFDGITQMSGESTTKAISQNGYSIGYLQSFNIDQTGALTGVYTNGQVRSLAQVSLASFTNPSGLEKVGENNYRMSNNSGIANVSTANSEGKGKIVAGALEMSNVDLAEEFTNMIVTQRGFQANSKIISTSDQMLQELLTLKR